MLKPISNINQIIMKVGHQEQQQNLTQKNILTYKWYDCYSHNSSECMFDLHCTKCNMNNHRTSDCYVDKRHRICKRKNKKQLSVITTNPKEITAKSTKSQNKNM